MGVKVELPNRQSIRKKGWDYTTPGHYFVTLNTHGSRPLFGTIVNGRMALNDAGRIAEEEWRKSAQIRAEIELDEFVVMANHVHGIVRIVGASGRTPARPVARPSGDLPVASGDLPVASGDLPVASGDLPVARTDCSARQGARLFPKSLGAFIAGYKGAVGKRLNQMRKSPGTAVWHRNYWDVIVRDAQALARIRDYIRFNPQNYHAVMKGAEPGYLGNRALLKLPQVGFLASRGAATPHGRMPLKVGEAILSGFLSPMERAVFKAGVAHGTPLIWVKPWGLQDGADTPPIRQALEDGRLLILSPFDDADEAPSARRAVWCNQYVLAHCNRMVVGHLNPDGMLACILSEATPDLEVCYLEDEPCGDGERSDTDHVYE
jgi:REP element-mobilizing transposase RayT